MIDRQKAGGIIAQMYEQKVKRMAVQMCIRDRVYMALSDGAHTWVRRMDPPGRVKNRSWVRDRAAHYALDMVRRYLAGMPVEGNAV